MMHKKILIAERSDAIRSIAESLLHQQGYDVLSASNATQATELMITGKPNLIIVGADLKDNNDAYLYDFISDNPKLSTIPLLIIEDPENRALPYPEEIILPRPFEPDQFLSRVKLFVGDSQGTVTETIVESDPLKSEEVSDEFLDAALGLDKLEIEDSEEVDKTEVTGKIQVKTKSKNKDIFDIAQNHENGKGDEDSGKVESLMIRETETGSLKTESPQATESSESTKIQIADDEYGFLNEVEDENQATSNKPQPTSKEPGDHDYDWFINEMKKESFDPNGVSKKASSSADKKSETEPPAAIPDSINTEEKPKINPGGVEKFISDFKKEVKQFSDTDENQAEPDSKAKTEPTYNVDIDDAEIDRLAIELVDILAEKLAKKLVEKIDKKDICLMLKDDMAEIIANRKSLKI